MPDNDTQTKSEPENVVSPLFSLYSDRGDGIHTPGNFSVTHREEEYNQSGFDVLFRMQSDHFWYQGRHRFITAAMKRAFMSQSTHYRSAIDLGGGCGGWVHFLERSKVWDFDRLALGDSSEKALQMAKEKVSRNISLYQIDLLNLLWENHWDAAFLLDVLEHLPDDEDAILQARKALRPGGILFVTTPAMQFFWSYNDELAKHQRRYAKKDFVRLARKTNLIPLNIEYFMFFLSPLYLLSRMRNPHLNSMSKEEKWKLICKTHSIPPSPINRLFSIIFSAESWFSRFMNFPWGTSILAVLQKPMND